MNTLSRRLVGAVPVLIGISFLIFLLMHIAPGDPVTLLLGDDATPSDVERARRDWGLDKPLLVQYWDFLSRAVTVPAIGTASMSSFTCLPTAIPKPGRCAKSSRISCATRE